jgi:hypothetical protein
MKSLVWKKLTPGFPLRRAETEFGDFRIWIEDDCWWWSLNDYESYGPEETFEEVKIASQKCYENLQVNNS